MTLKLEFWVLPNGTITGAITDAGNGWYRCSVVVTSQVTTGFIPVYSLVQTTTSTRAPSYTGQGVGAGDMLLLWGAQIEKTDSITDIYQPQLLRYKV